MVEQIRAGFDVDRVYRGDDGDIAIPVDGSVVFVRAHEHGSPFLELYALLLAECDLSADVYPMVNAINAQISLPKVIVDAETRRISMEARLPVDGLSANALLLSVELVGGAARHFALPLRRRFGGRRMLDHTAAPKRDL